MANFFLDISAPGNEYQAYADTPTTWNKPQDGNGKAQSASAAAVAIATIDCASASASGAGSLSLLGVTVSSTLTGSAATLAASIVTAINAAATAVSASYSAALLLLNRLVWARQNPGLTTQVQIMMRVAGTDWNGMLPVSGGTWSVAPTMGAFAGGVDGPFAYFINASTVFGKAAALYGVRCQKSAGVTDPSAANDYIWTRTQRSGSNLTCVFSLSATIYVMAQANRNFIFDAGNTWSGDNGKFTLAISFTAAASFSLDPLSASGIVNCDAEAAGGFTVTGTSTTAGATLFVNARNSTNPNQRYVNCAFEELNINVAVQVYGSDGSRTRMVDCWFRFKTGHALITSAFSVMGFVFEGGGVEFSGLSGDVATLWAINSSQIAIHYRLRNFACVDVTGGIWKVTTPLSGASTLASTTYVSCEFDNVSGFRAPSFGFLAYNGGRPQHSGYYQSADGDRPFRYECNLYTTDWIDDGTFPTAGSLLPSGNEWSMRCTWLAAIDRSTDCTPFTRSTFYRDASGIKTLTLEMLCSNTMTPKTGDLYMAVSYTDSTGVRRTEKTICSIREDIAGTDAALAAGNATWNYRGLTGFSPKKIALTTAYAIKLNTSVTVSLTLCGTPASNTSIYINPEVTFS